MSTCRIPPAPRRASQGRVASRRVVASVAATAFPAIAVIPTPVHARPLPSVHPANEVGPAVRAARANGMPTPTVAALPALVAGIVVAATAAAAGWLPGVGIGLLCFAAAATASPNAA